MRRLLLVLALTVAAVLPASVSHAAAPSSAVATTATTSGPHCPEQYPDRLAPGAWLTTFVNEDGKYVDVYRVPFYFGFQIVSVVCD